MSSPLMGDLLSHAGFCLRSRTRADCAHCSGTSTGTVAYNAELAHCFRCGWAANARGLARSLGLLREKSLSPEEYERLRRERQALRQHAEVLLAVEKAAFLEAQERVLQVEAMRRNAGSRLGALRGGAPERYACEEENVWQALVEVHNQMPRAAAAYNIIAFAAHRDRLAFALDPQARDRPISAALEGGHVIDERGYRFEVQL